MSVEYYLVSAQALYDKAEREASAGMNSAAQVYRAAARQYRKAAEALPNERNKYIAMAEECEAKAGAPVSARPSAQQTSAPRAPGAGRDDKQSKSAAAAKPTVREVQAEELTVEQALQKLNALIGLESVKTKVNAWVKQVRYLKSLEEDEIDVSEDFSYHMIFAGNPGTGKTTVARLMGQIYRALGILEKGHVVEVSRSDLVAGFVGQTAIKTQEVIDSALGGVLFVDEAYTLDRGGPNDFGQEALDTLLKGMEDHRKELVVIVAGYKDRMDKLMEGNEGLASRFNNLFEFENYTPDEMMSIFGSFCKDTFRLSPPAREALYGRLSELYNMHRADFGNARTVRNIYQNMIVNLASRVMSLGRAPTREEKVVFESEDVPPLSAIK